FLCLSLFFSFTCSTDIRPFPSFPTRRSSDLSLRRLMERYFEEMKAVVERHGGITEKFIGDAIMATFGIPRAHEDDALRAERCHEDRKSTRLNSSHVAISYAVFCLKKKNKTKQ